MIMTAALDTQHVLHARRGSNVHRQFSFSRQLSRSNSALLMNPLRQSINRTPFQVLSPTASDKLEQEQQYHVPEQHGVGGDGDIMGSILPSAQLYHERASGIPFDLTQLTLESYRRREYHGMVDTDDAAVGDFDSAEMDIQYSESKQESKPPLQHGGKVITYHQQYVVYYRHEAVCIFRASYEVHAHGTSGQSLNVTWRKGNLQTRILHKGRTSTGQGWNAQEQRTYRVLDILEASAERYAKKQLLEEQQPPQQQPIDQQTPQLLEPSEQQQIVVTVEEEPSAVTTSQ